MQVDAEPEQGRLRNAVVLGSCPFATVTADGPPSRSFHVSALAHGCGATQPRPHGALGIPARSVVLPSGRDSNFPLHVSQRSPEHSSDRGNESAGLDFSRVRVVPPRAGALSFRWAARNFT